MHHITRPNDSVHWYMSELTSRIIAESGHPWDRYHLGKMILQSFKDEPEFVLQIDGGKNDSETNKSVLKRSVKCATAMKNFGLSKGDVMVLMAPNHLDVAIPYYAALYLGIAIAPVDRTLNVNELKAQFNITKPKIIFCQSEKAADIKLALNQIDHSVEIITFDKGEYLCSFQEFLDKYSDGTSMGEFKCADFDPEETISLLIPTSGTTGVSKFVAATHKNLAITGPYSWERLKEFPLISATMLLGSELVWMSTNVHFIMSPIIKYTRLHTSSPLTYEHTGYVINTYKPSLTILSPTFATRLINSEQREKCDFTCLKAIVLLGSVATQELIDDIQKIAPTSEVSNIYGMTEMTSLGFNTVPTVPTSTPKESCGKPLGCFQYRLVDPETQEDIIEPNKPGELWMKGPGMFKHYYNNPQATEETFAADRWFKTGDMFYRDEQWNFYFVERIKMLLKYNLYHISPEELEAVIRKHPGVLDVAVTGVPDRECGDLPVACVVRRAGTKVTAREIKDLVKDRLSESKQLRGGVIFIEELPLTPTLKINRKKLKEMVLTMKRE